MTNEDRNEMRQLIDRLHRLDDELTAKTGEKVDDLSEIFAKVKSLNKAKTKSVGKAKKEKPKEIELENPDDNLEAQIDPLVHDAFARIDSYRRDIINSLYDILEYADDMDIKLIKKMIRIETEQILKLKKIEKYY